VYSVSAYRETDFTIRFSKEQKKIKIISSMFQSDLESRFGAILK